MNTQARWLQPFTWEFVTAQNEVLCQQKSAHHGPTSDGHSSAKNLWEDARTREMGISDAVEVYRNCHKIAPFTNFNGNTFAAIARIIGRKLNLAPENEYLARSLAGHIVAGVASDEEIRAFKEFCASLS